MFTKLLIKEFVITVAVQVILHAVQLGALSNTNNCLTGGFFFAPGRNMINNHALYGHVFLKVTVAQPIRCFERCQSDCRCISFNYLTNVNENNCELNEENRYTNFSALRPVEGSQYYDLTINYDIRGSDPLAECQNGCCGSQPCLNGGTCHETCDVTGKRFTCSCKPFAIGKFCETAICSTPDWLRLDNSCFKEFTEKVNWFTAQRACQNFNSSLTSIHTGKENDFIRERVVSSNDSSAWIGLNNLKNNTKFEWTDGSVVSFTNWAPKEPNNAGGENCTELHVLTGNWNDLNCSSENRTYVCEKRF